MTGQTGSRIIVVEDDPDARSLLQLLLQRSGYTDVLLASHGQEALPLIEQNNPNLIISDWMMPVMGGHELLTTVKQEKRYRDIPFVVVSALEPTRCSAPLWDDFIPKPIDLRHLLRTIGSLIKSG